MKRTIGLGLGLLVALCTLAPRSYTPMITATDCTTQACSSLYEMCRNTGGVTFFVCNTSTARYEAVGGAGSSAFNALTSGTNTAASMTVGSGATLTSSGTGVVTANRFVTAVSTTNNVDLATAEVNGTLPLANGGTNQTSWTASRCVQVNAGGTALESASGACGSGGSPTFDAIGTGTNTTATMTVGTGGTLNTSGSGIIAATRYLGSGSTTNEVDLATAEAAGTLTATKGGTGIDTSASTGVPRISAGTWSTNAGLSHLASSTSADLRGTLSDETGTGVAVFSSPTALTLDVEAGSNSITTVSKMWIEVATCQNATATVNLDTPTTNAATASCITGSNTQKGVLDFDQTTAESVQGSVMLPADWTGNIDVAYKWLTTATSGTVAWCMQLICVADGETDDPAFPAVAAGNCVSDTAKGTTNQTNDATKAAITATGCAAGELMHFKLSRDPAEVSGQSDTCAADARLIGVEFTLRRAQ